MRFEVIHHHDKRGAWYSVIDNSLPGPFRDVMTTRTRRKAHAWARNANRNTKALRA